MPPYTIQFAILTISDRSARGERPDASGPALIRVVEALGWQVIRTAVVPDDRDRIIESLNVWVNSDQIDVILTTGGTGFGPRDMTPEATSAVIERSAPGLAEAMRQSSLQVTPHAMLSRAVAGIARQTLIVNLPGSPKAAVENFNVLTPVLPHAVQLLRGDIQSEQTH